MPSSAAGQPTPDATPSFQVVATETPTAKPSVAPYNDHELKPGESITVTGSALVQGDVVVDGKILYDNRSETGLIVEINGGTHTITAPFGADVQEFGTKVDSEVFASTEGTDVELMKEKGCGLPTGCEKVIIDKVN